MEDIAVLEREIGLDTGIYDFISRNSSPELRKKAARSLAGYVIDGYADKDTVPKLNWYLEDMREAT